MSEQFPENLRDPQEIFDQMVTVFRTKPHFMGGPDEETVIQQIERMNDESFMHLVAHGLSNRKANKLLRHTKRLGKMLYNLDVANPDNITPPRREWNFIDKKQDTAELSE